MQKLLLDLFERLNKTNNKQNNSEKQIVPPITVTILMHFVIKSTKLFPYLCQTFDSSLDLRICHVSFLSLVKHNLSWTLHYNYLWFKTSHCYYLRVQLKINQLYHRCHPCRHQLQNLQYQHKSCSLWLSCSSCCKHWHKQSWLSL